MIDIVFRLREQAMAPALVWLNEAANEIENLRSQLNAVSTLVDVLTERLHELTISNLQN